MNPNAQIQNRPTFTSSQEGKQSHQNPGCEKLSHRSEIQNSALPYVSFELPQGFAKEGRVYRQGQMRLATGEDEWVAQQSVQAVDNNAYSLLIRLSRVTSFTGYPHLCPDDMGHLFMPDLNYLLELYNTLNPPDCELSLLGEFQAIPGHS